MAIKLFWHKFQSLGIWSEAEEEDRLHINGFLPGSLSQIEIEDVLKKALAVLMPAVPHRVMITRVEEALWQTAWQRHSVGSYWGHIAILGSGLRSCIFKYRK